MFVFCLKNLAHDELAAKYLPLAEQMRIIGTYAQTEMGHGSNVRGLETTATCIFSL
jgi:acyl-CoA oxidase